MRNLSSNKLFQCHSTYTVMAKIASTLKLMNMSEYFKLPNFNPDLLGIAMVKSYVTSMKQDYISYWQNTLQHPAQKLEFYRSFKTDHTSPSHSDLTRGTAGRRALFSKTTNKQSQTNDRNRQIQSNYEG